uniref:Uncharacterized protein n=1 Tax=Panagrolaimus sp. PS1159 TaxID=55785 RepID=A0AC35FZG3_9BILA
MFSRYAVLIFVVFPAIVAGATYTDAVARKMLTDAGITIVSSGGCSDQNNAHCTSLTGIHSEVINGAYGIIVFKKKSGCAIEVTGGTEIGHAAGTYSHHNGWKLDIHMTSCMTKYIEKNFQKVNPTHWKEPGSGYIFYNENNHWDCCFHAGCAV